MKKKPFFVPGSVRMRVTAAILPDGRELRNVPFLRSDGTIVLQRADALAAEERARTNALGEVLA